MNASRTLAAHVQKLKPFFKTVRTALHGMLWCESWSLPPENTLLLKTALCICEVDRFRHEHTLQISRCMIMNHHCTVHIINASFGGQLIQMKHWDRNLCLDAYSSSSCSGYSCVPPSLRSKMGYINLQVVWAEWLDWARFTNTEEERASSRAWVVM